MENVVNAHGAFPTALTDTDELQLPEPLETEISAVYPDEPREHIRSPELHRNGTKLLMAFAAAAGAAMGARLLFSGDGTGVTLPQAISGTFWELFAYRITRGAVLLAAELVLGMFALGDLAVWAAPFICAAGTVLRLSAGPAKALPAALVSLIAVALGAAYSADMSGLLMKLSRGGTVYMETNPRRGFALRLFACLVAVAGAAILDGALLSTQ